MSQNLETTETGNPNDDKCKDQKFHGRIYGQVKSKAKGKFTGEASSTVFEKLEEKQCDDLYVLEECKKSGTLGLSGFDRKKSGTVKVRLFAAKMEIDRKKNQESYAISESYTHQFETIVKWKL